MAYKEPQIPKRKRKMSQVSDSPTKLHEDCELSNIKEGIFGIKLRGSNRDMCFPISLGGFPKITNECFV